MKIPDYSQPNHLNPYKPNECHFWNLFGSIIQSVGNYLSVDATNSQNYDIALENINAQREMQREAQAHADAMLAKEHAFNSAEAEKARAFNSAEAETARQFNSLEAEKARLWNSESEVMKRRTEAGLNTAITGSGVTSLGGSSASASGPSASGPAASGSAGQVIQPPHLATPTMQAFQMDGLADAVMDAIKLPAEIDNTKANTKVASEQAELIAKQAENALLEQEYLKYRNVYSQKDFDQKIKMLQLEFESSKTDLETKKIHRDAFAEMSNLQATNMYLLMASSLQEFDLRASNSLQQAEEAIANYDFLVSKYIDDWKRHSFDLSYEFGSTISLNKGKSFGYNTSISTDIQANLGIGESVQSRNDTRIQDGNTGGKGNWSMLKNFSLAKLVGVNVGISPTVSGFMGGSLSTDDGSQFVKHMHNELLLHKALQFGASAYVLKSAKKDWEAAQALRKMGTISEYIQKLSSAMSAIERVRMDDRQRNPYLME